MTQPCLFFKPISHRSAFLSSPPDIAVYAVLHLCCVLSDVCLLENTIPFPWIKNHQRASLVVQWPRLCTLNAGGLGLIPGQVTGSRMLQLRVHRLPLKIPQLQRGWKIPCAATETNTAKFKKKKKKLPRMQKCSKMNHYLMQHNSEYLHACGPPASSVHGILQARILEWVAMPSSRGSSWPKDRTCVSCIAGRFFTTELLGNPQ